MMTEFNPGQSSAIHFNPIQPSEPQPLVPGPLVPEGQPLTPKSYPGLTNPIHHPKGCKAS